MPNQNRMHETLHLPSAPTVLIVKTVPWFLEGWGGGNQGVQGCVEEITRTAASCDVRVAAAVRVRLCVCERRTNNLTRSDREKTIKQGSLSGSWAAVKMMGKCQIRTWGFVSPKIFFVSPPSNQTRRSLHNTRMSRLIPEMFRSHCAPVQAPLFSNKRPPLPSVVTVTATCSSHSDVFLFFFKKRRLCFNPF